MHTHNNFLFIEVPEGVTDLIAPAQDYGGVLQYKHNGRWYSEELPHGDYGTPILASQVTEDLAGKIVDSVLPKQTDTNCMPNTFIDYTTKPPYHYFNEALPSFHSLLTSLSLTAERTVVVEKK